MAPPAWTPLAGAAAPGRRGRVRLAPRPAPLHCRSTAGGGDRREVVPWRGDRTAADLPAGGRALPGARPAPARVRGALPPPDERSALRRGAAPVRGGLDRTRPRG